MELVGIAEVAHPDEAILAAGGADIRNGIVGGGTGVQDGDGIASGQGQVDLILASAVGVDGAVLRRIEGRVGRLHGLGDEALETDDQIAIGAIQGHQTHIGSGGVLALLPCLGAVEELIVAHVHLGLRCTYSR